MMRRVLMLGAVGLASASDQTQCALDGAASMNSMADAALNIWASTKRCDKGAALDARCAVDISSTIHSVNDMIMTIVSAVEDCGAIHTEHYECGMAVGGLTSASAALAAASGGSLLACPNSLKQANPPFDTSTQVGKCVIDAKSSMASLFSASASLKSVKKNCDTKGSACDNNALNVVSGLADLGSFLAAAVNDCSLFKGAGNADAACESSSLALVSALSHIGTAGLAIADKCKVSKAERLYLENGEATPTGSSLPLALAAMLPLSAVVSFVAGSRFAKSRTQSVRDADCEQLMEE